MLALRLHNKVNITTQNQRYPKKINLMEKPILAWKRRYLSQEKTFFSFPGYYEPYDVLQQPTQIPKFQFTEIYVSAVKIAAFLIEEEESLRGPIAIIGKMNKFTCAAFVS